MSNSFDKKIGEIAKKKREEKKVTQKQMAEYCNTTIQSISNFECGRVHSGKLFGKYSEIFGLDTVEIIWK